MGAYCAVFRCVANRGYLTCAECPEYPTCPRLLRSLKIEEGLDSFLSHRPALTNLDEIREHGLESFLIGQRERRLLVEQLLSSYNAGRSMTLYCTACALLPPRVIEQALHKVERSVVEGKLPRDDRKGLAREMRRALLGLAERMGVDLSLRRRRREDQRSG